VRIVAPDVGEPVQRSGEAQVPPFTGRVAVSWRDRSKQLSYEPGNVLWGAMKKKPETALEQFNSFFTTQVLMGIIGGLLGIIAMRLMSL
jgi:hypothetical protein